MHTVISDRPAVTVTPIPAAASQDDARRALESAQERYTAARRKYTSLYVESKPLERPDQDLVEAIEAARSETLEMAASLRMVEDGDPEAIRNELAAGRVSDSERARTTDRFTIAELHRAAAAAPASWDWKP